jgi:hypothetical protein
MATLAGTPVVRTSRTDHLSGTPRAGFIDRWIYVFTAASFIVIVLTGFIPDSLMKIEMVRAGQRPPLPIAMHFHAVLMGAFLLLLLTQTVLVATGRCALHRRVGIAAFALVPALVLAGLILVPTIYHQVWGAFQAAPAAARAAAQQHLFVLDDIMLLQLRIGILFPLFIGIALMARGKNAGIHKRMMILATAMPLPAAWDRMSWVPSTMPLSPWSPDLYVLLSVLPMFAWDVLRNRGVHPAYLIWIAINLPFAVAVHGLWDTPWWHAVAPRLMGVG